MSQQFRLNDAALEQLEKLVGPPMVGKDTTELQAGWMLGVQYMMRVLRDGFTVPSNKGR